MMLSRGYGTFPEKSEPSVEISQAKASSEDEVLLEFNKKYAVIHTSTTAILVEKEDGNFVLDSRQSLIAFHENDFFYNSKSKKESKARFWLRHPCRRTYIDIVFDPLRKGNFGGKYNIFKGFAIDPIKRDCSLYWNHLKEVICNGNTKHYQYVRKWMASVLQKPGLIGTALVLRGLQGTGKNIFVDFFGKIFGRYFLTITSLDHLVGKFNSHLQNAFVIFANESIWGGNKKELGALKALITDPTIIIEGKGKDAFEIKNFRHLIISSNEDWAIHMDLDDRRFFPLNVSDKRKEDIPYFRAIVEQMQNGGVQGLMYDLLNEDLKEFDPRKMPPNDMGFDMKLKSCSSIEKYVFEALRYGALNISDSPNEWYWGDISSRHFYCNYRLWCTSEGLIKETNVDFGKGIRKLLPIRKRRLSISGQREWIYAIPPLGECRLAFQKHVKHSDEIWDERE